MAQGAEKLETLIGTMCCTQITSAFGGSDFYICSKWLEGDGNVQLECSSVKLCEVPRRELAAKPPQPGLEWASHTAECAN